MQDNTNNRREDKASDSREACSSDRWKVDNKNLETDHRKDSGEDSLSAASGWDRKDSLEDSGCA